MNIWPRSEERWNFEDNLSVYIPAKKQTFVQETITLLQFVTWRIGPVHTIRFQTKTELFCSGYGDCPHNSENDHRKRSHSKTLSRVEWFENDGFWKRCFLLWTVKMMLSENGDVIKIDMTRRQTTRPWVSKMADRPYRNFPFRKQAIPLWRHLENF